MLRKIIVTLFILMFTFTSLCFAFDGATHIRSLEKMKDVPIKDGGLGGKLNFEDQRQINELIDQNGKGGGYHRHNGSHSSSISLKENSSFIKKKGWNIKAYKNVVSIHNIYDMAEPGCKGTNGWTATPKRRAEALRLKDKISKGEKITAPKWASETGPKTKVTPGYKKYCKKVKAGKIVLGKSISNKKVSTIALKKAGNRVGKYILKAIGPITVAYTTYEAVNYGHHLMFEDIIIEEEIITISKTATTMVASTAGWQVGLVVCAPLEAFGGPVLHIGAASVCSFLSALIASILMS